MAPDNLQNIRRDIEEADQSSDYVAVDLLWVALLKRANEMLGTKEHKRMLALVNTIPLEKQREILHHPAVDSLLNLDPPLESVLANPHEHLDPEKTAEALIKVRTFRDSNPSLALSKLGEILKRIRNKRAHGFKTPKGNRDSQILGAARQILRELCRVVVS